MSHTTTACSLLSNPVDILSTTEASQGNEPTWSVQMPPHQALMVTVEGAATGSPFGKVPSLPQMLPMPDVNQFHLNDIWSVGELSKPSNVEHVVHSLRRLEM